MTDEHHDRETVVVRDTGTGMGAILGVIALLIVLAAAWYFLLGPGAGSTSTNNGGGNGGTNAQPAPSLEVPNPGAS